MKYPEIIISEDFKLSLVQPDDAWQTFDLIDNSRAYLKEWLPWVDYVHSVEDCSTNINKAIQNFEQNGILEMSIKKDNQVIGRIGLHFIDKMNRKTSIGYWLGEKYQGNGYMTKAVDALCNYCFESLNINRIEIACGTENHKSKALIQSLNFKLEGVTREREWLNGNFIDHELYAKLRND
jgi:ribosomal-protein-serine acetyltransferase